MDRGRMLTRAAAGLAFDTGNLNTEAEMDDRLELRKEEDEEEEDWEDEDDEDLDDDDEDDDDLDDDDDDFDEEE
jgi:hypothetical protein